MKIAQIELFEVDIPPIPPIAKYSPKIFELTLCRIHTDEGLIGIGEAHGKPANFVAQADAYTGQDPLALDPFAQPEAFECALLDIAAQAAGLPLYRFFGAKVRDKGTGLVLVPADGAARDRRRGRGRRADGL